MKFFVDKVKSSEYYIATYEIISNTNLREAAWDLALGQSVGNPNMRNSYETEELFAKHSCLILGDQEQLSADKQGIVKIAFPVINTDWDTDGISHLLCQLMGGHVDIDVIRECRLIKLDLPKSVTKHFLGPKYGLSGIRKLTKQYDKPLLGAIVKPKIGISADTLLDIVKQLVDGGVDFIKEDEIMSNPIFCPLDQRVELISNYLAKQSRKIVFCHTINCDPHILVDRVKRVHELGGNGVHINVYSGLGSYNSIRKLDLPLFIHFQKSGDRVFTCRENRYSIAWSVICQLATLMGVDTIQTGMIGGYSNDDPKEIKECLKILHEGNTLPALSCGMHPGLVDHVSELIGIDYLANVGGAIHSHDGGTLAGTKAMRQAIDKDYGSEYISAINQYGKV